MKDGVVKYLIGFIFKALKTSSIRTGGKDEMIVIVYKDSEDGRG